MRVQCPHCQKTVTLDNAKAEQPTPCPECGHIFTAPSLLNSLPDEPIPPVPTPVPAPSSAVVVPPAPVAVSAAKAPTAEPCCSFVISRRVVHWFGPVALFVAFVATFFNWIVAAPGGMTVYSQSAWSIAWGSCDADSAGDKVFGQAKDLNEKLHGGFFMFLTFLLLLAALLIGLGDLFQQYINVPVPDIINNLWPHRTRVLVGVSLALFLYWSLQFAGSLGLEAAAATLADERFPALAENAEQPFRRAENVSRLGLRRTNWLWLTYLALAVATMGFGLELLLDRRGKKQPDPRIEFHW